MVFPPIVLIHVCTALLALIVGATMLVREKGTPIHRLSGRIWVGLMLVAVLLSFGIRRTGSFSPIHLLSITTLISISVALVALYRHDILTHRRWMGGTYVGLLTAGALSLQPHRRLGHLVWHAAGLA